MIDPLTLFKEGGPLAFALLVWVAAPAPALVLGATIAHFLRVRVPLIAWLATVAVAGGLGLLATIQGYGMTTEAAGHASPTYRNALLHNGSSVSVFVEVMAAMVSAPTLAVLTWVVAIGARTAHSDGVSEPDPLSKVGLAILACAGLAAAAIVAVKTGGGVAVVPVGLFMLTAPASLLVLGRRSSTPAPAWVESRMAVLVMLGATGFAASWFLLRSGQIIELNAVANASAEMKAVLIERGSAQAAAGQLQLVALFGAPLGLAFGIGWLDRDHLDARALLGFSSAILTGVCLLLLLFWAEIGASPLR